MGSRIIEWCDLCGKSAGEFPLFPLLIESGTPQEEGWERYKLDLCEECWEMRVRDPLNVLIHEVLQQPEDKAFGSYDFYADADEDEALAAWRFAHESKGGE